MGRGIALAYALSGVSVSLLDAKQRNSKESVRLEAEVSEELRTTLNQLVELRTLTTAQADLSMARISLFRQNQALDVMSCANIVYEAVPETLDAKRDALEYAGNHASPDAVIASTTSTMLASDLAPMVYTPDRFLNAHWLNPAYLVPLVEVSTHQGTSQQTLERFLDSLESIGKIPVVCGSHPGFIVPRLQALIMSEAARMVSEGVASADDIDKATRYGLGVRFASMGALEFIDYGGNDTLHLAYKYLARNIATKRYAERSIVTRYMEMGRNGLRDGQRFYSNPVETEEAYREDVPSRLAGMLHHMGLATMGA